MSLQGLQDHSLDFHDRLSQKLLTGNSQQVFVSHNLDLTKTQGKGKIHFVFLHSEKSFEIKVNALSVNNYILFKSLGGL